MPQLSFVTLDVFTRTKYRGNPLAVVRIPPGQDVSTQSMQTIAREFNLSETIFLYERPARVLNFATWHVRIFMTDSELPFAGHPTIGVSCYTLGKFMCNAGPIKVAYEDGVATAAIPHNVHVHSQQRFTEEDVYELHPSLPRSKKPKAIDVVSPVKGMNFVCIELPDLEALGTVDNHGAKPTPRLDDQWDVGFCGSYLYVLTDDSSSVLKLRTRMMEGLLEDPATGSAACALGALLAIKLKRDKTTNFEITQGVEMGRQSDIGVVVTLEDDMNAVAKIELSGSAVKVMEGVLEYD